MISEVDRKSLTTILYVVSDKLGWHLESEPPDHTFSICNCESWSRWRMKRGVFQGGTALITKAL